VGGFGDGGGGFLGRLLVVKKGPLFFFSWESTVVVPVRELVFPGGSLTAKGGVGFRAASFGSFG